MDQMISDAEISSCQEMEEMRQEAERIEVEELETSANEQIRRAMNQEHEIHQEKHLLEEQLENELRYIDTLQEELDSRHEAYPLELQNMLDWQSELGRVNLDTLNLLSTLQDFREQNHATLRADPIYNLVQEERQLQQQLDELGIYVHPPTDSDEHYQ